MPQDLDLSRDQWFIVGEALDQGNVFIFYEKKNNRKKQNKNKTTQISLLGLYAKRLQTGSCNKSPNTIQPMLPSPRPLTPKRQKLQEHGPFKTLAL